MSGEDREGAGTGTVSGAGTKEGESEFAVRFGGGVGEKEVFGGGLRENVCLDSGRVVRPSSFNNRMVSRRSAL